MSAITVEHDEAVIAAKTERSQKLLEAVEDFLTEGLCSASTLGVQARLGGHFVVELRKGRKVKEASAARVYVAMSYFREREQKAIERDIAAIRALPHGVVVTKPTGEIDVAPAGIGEARLKKLIDRGILTPSGDTLFAGIPSQTYRLASNVA